MKTFLKRVSILAVGVLVLSCSSDSSTPACTPIACLNGGVSTADCGCDCPQGYSGSNCGVQITPLQVKITKIRVKKFPDTENGQWWDTFPNSDADIYVTMQNSNQTTIYSHPNYKPDSSSTGTNYFDFIPSTPILITNPTGLFIMNIYDYENTGTNTLMDYCIFNNLYSSTGGFPSTKTFTNDTGTFSFELTLSYVW
jgi:hypothetical protein